MKMTRKIIFGILTILLGSQMNGQTLDERFHSYEEIFTFLDSLQAIPGNSQLLMVDTIGYSQREHLPIPAVKISDNVAVKEDEPRVLFLGQVHAEEILGVEAVLRLIENLLDPPTSQALHTSILRNNLEIWIVPTYNPEGMQVVFSELDVSYRKNKHDFSPDGPWPNGIFDFDPGVGNDIDGVDPNRNFDFNWFFGESFLEQDPTPYGAHYDYFKGLAPFSESETRAVRDLALAQDFVLSIALHSSRSGNLSEKVFYPWDWDGKTTPDNAAIANIGTNIANLIETEAGGTHYLLAAGGSRNGKAHDWFYVATGCFQYLIECGTANLQPDSLIIEDTVQRLQPALLYLMDRAIGYYTEASQLTGIVTDESGNELEDVQVQVLELSGDVQQPRLTDEFGRYRRIVRPGTFNLVFSKAGFSSDTAIVTANASLATDYSPVLTALPTHTVTINLEWTGSLMPDYIEAVFRNSSQVDTVMLDVGANQVPLAEGRWDYHINPAAFLPWTGTLLSAAGATYDFQLQTPDLYQVLTLDDSMSWESVEGDWSFGDTLKSQSGWLYPNAVNDSDLVRLTSPVIDAGNMNYLTAGITHRRETEWGVDFVSIRLTDTAGNNLAEWSAAGHSWNEFGKTWLSAGADSGLGAVRLVLELECDGTVNYRGWQITEITLAAGSSPVLGVDQTRAVISGGLLKVSNPYPNPSTGMVKIDLHGSAGPARITIYNLLGQQVFREVVPAGSHRPVHRAYDFTNPELIVGSGIYFFKIETPQNTVVKKCIILKN